MFGEYYYLCQLNIIFEFTRVAKKVMKNLRITLVMVATLAFLFSEAQIGTYFSKFRPAKKWSVGLQISPTHLNGDADDAKLGLAFGAHAKYSVSQSFGLKLSGNIGSLRGGRLEPDFSGNKSDGRFGANTVAQQDPNNGNLFNLGNQASGEDSYQFTNNFRDLDITAVYTLGNISFLRPLRKLQLFTFFGAGVIWSDVSGNFENEDDPARATAEAQQYYKDWGDRFFTGIDVNGNTTTNVDDVVDAETNYVGRNLTIPFGVGVKRNFGRWLDLGVEWKTRWTRSDNLDGFSFPVWRNRYSDFYSTLGIQASVKLGTKGREDHYDWLNPMETIYSDMEEMKVTTDKLKTLVEDADGDGVGDFFDKEDTDSDAKVYGDGTAVDTDRDGVPDHKDKEIFSRVTDVDADGVAKDSDGDGIPDAIDEEPNTAAGKLVDVRGKAVEINDGGGNCCDCDNVTLPSVIFSNGSSRISPESYAVLYAVAEKLKQCPNLSISAVGYTTSKSGEQLAYKRATSIIDHLEANYGIERDRVSVDYSTESGSEYSTRRIDFSSGK
jgi:outer membrane protein OmpA-like peptidoglycan-associated protein